MAKRTPKKSDTAANLGFEAKMWLAADKLRNNIDAAEYKHVVLGLIFLKYISDAFHEHPIRSIARGYFRVFFLQSAAAIPDNHGAGAFF